MAIRMSQRGLVRFAKNLRLFLMAELLHLWPQCCPLGSWHDVLGEALLALLASNAGLWATVGTSLLELQS